MNPELYQDRYLVSDNQFIDILEISAITTFMMDESFLIYMKNSDTTFDFTSTKPFDAFCKFIFDAKLKVTP